MDERVSSENKLLCNLTFEDKNVNFIPAGFFFIFMYILSDMHTVDKSV